MHVVVKQNPRNPQNPQNPGLEAFNCRTMAAAAAVGKTKIAVTDPLIRPDKGLRKRSAQPCKAEPTSSVKPTPNTRRCCALRGNKQPLDSLFYAPLSFYITVYSQLESLAKLFSPNHSTYAHSLIASQSSEPCCVVIAPALADLS